MSTDKEIIMYDSPEAAKKETLTGWVSGGNGGYPKRYYGEDEHMARWAGCTHLKCECGEIMGKSYTRCEKCRHKLDVERYNALKFKEWDYVEPVCTWGGDTYFFDIETLEEFMLENEQWEIDLIICDPVHYRHIDSEDVVKGESHEDWEPPAELEKKIEKFNDYLRTLPPHSWMPGKIRTSYKSEDVKAELEKLKTENP